jgi:hypothetical protein
MSNGGQYVTLDYTIKCQKSKYVGLARNGIFCQTCNGWLRVQERCVPIEKKNYDVTKLLSISNRPITVGWD